MGILKELLNEIKIKSGIYDLNGNFVRGNYNNDTIDKYGRKNVDFRYLFANGTIEYLKNAFDNKNINMDFFKYVLDNNNTNINPLSGFYIDKDGNKINLYSFPKLVNIISHKKEDGKNLTFFKDGNQYYVMSPLFAKFFDEDNASNNYHKNDNNKNVDNIKWQINRDIRSRYDPSEKKDDE